MEIYKVAEVDMYGCETKPQFFQVWNNAEEEFDKRMKELQGKLDVAKSDDELMYGSHPVHIRTKKDEILNHPSSLKEGVINYWFSCKGDWDMAYITVVIEPIQVL